MIIYTANNYFLDYDNEKNNIENKNKFNGKKIALKVIINNGG